MQLFLRKWLVPPGVLQAVLKLLTLFKRITRSSSDRELLAHTRNLRDRHLGRRCFIFGAGSSIATQDLSKLEGEMVISVSNTFVHPEFSRIKPTYHIIPPLIGSHGYLYSTENFVVWLRAMERATTGCEMFFHIGDRTLIESNQLFKNHVIHWLEYERWDGDFNTQVSLSRIPNIWSVSEAALTAAVFLGFDNIYLIGIDHDWFNGLHVYFFDHKKDHLLKPNFNKLDYIDSEFQMRRHADIFRKYKYLKSIKNNISNANSNKNTYLDVFPKVDFNSLF